MLEHEKYILVNATLHVSSGSVSIRSRGQYGANTGQYLDRVQ